MRVFVLCTGRSGSTSVIRACRLIRNYTASHESLVQGLGDKRFDYPDNHIEADNRLSWFLGELDAKYGDDPVYVHLIRDKSETIRSFGNRWKSKVGIVRHYAEGIKMLNLKSLSAGEREQLCGDYYVTVNSNIELFLKDKSKVITIELSNIKSGFAKLWEMISAEGDLEEALKVFDSPLNKSRQSNRFVKFVKKLLSLDFVKLG